MSELELIALAQAGDRRAADRLIRMHHGFLCLMARRYRIPGYDESDKLQLTRIGLLEAIRDFKPDAGCKLLTLAVHRIRKQFHLAIMPHRAKKRTAITLSFESPIPDTDIVIADIIAAPEETTEQQYMPVLQQAITTIKRKTDRTILETIAAHLAIDETITLQQIGDQFGMSRERIRQLKERAVSGPAFKKLREEIRA